MISTPIEKILNEENEQRKAPKYEVIADYPDNKDFPVGSIIELKPWRSSNAYWEYSVTDCQGERLWLSDFFNKYPHIFKRINP